MTKICPTSAGICQNSAPRQLPAYPSIYGMWKIRLESEDGSYERLSVPDTYIPLAAELTLCKLRGSKTVPDLLSAADESTGDSEEVLSRRRRSWPCCPGNTYLNFTSSTCHPCPSGSQSKYDGLFCGTNLKMLLAPSNQNYFTLALAEQACIDDNGKRIATPSDMAAAKALGYSECNCGWLSDGSVQSPSPRPFCREALNRSTTTCAGQTTWDTYCVKNF